MEHPHRGSGRGPATILSLWGGSPGLYSSKIILLPGEIPWNQINSTPPCSWHEQTKLCLVPCLQSQGAGRRGLWER